MAAVWSIDVGSAAERGLGPRVGGSLFDIVVTLTLASPLWGLVRTALRQGAVLAEAGDGESGSAGAASRLHGASFLQPLKSQGVHRMDDSAFIIRVKFMAKPGEQFVLRREAFRRIQEAFAAAGIEFAPRRVIVDGGKDAAAAAAVAADPGEATGAAAKT